MTEVRGGSVIYYPGSGVIGGIWYKQTPSSPVLLQFFILRIEALDDDCCSFLVFFIIKVRDQNFC